MSKRHDGKAIIVTGAAGAIGFATAEILAYAEQHGLTDDQARLLLTEHGHDESGLSEALQSLKHFLKAPS